MSEDQTCCSQKLRLYKRIAEKKIRYIVGEVDTNEASSQTIFVPCDLLDIADLCYDQFNFNKVLRVFQYEKV